MCIVFYNAFNIIYRLSANGNNDLRDVFILVFAHLRKIHLVFSFSLGPNHIKWTTHTDSWGHYHFIVILKKKRQANCLLHYFLRPGIPTGRVFICVSFHSRLPGRPTFPKGRFLSQHNESLKPVWSVLHSKKSFRIPYYLTRKPHPQKMQRIPLAVILLMLRFQVNSWT